MIVRALWAGAFVFASYWVITAKTSEAVTTLIGVAATLLAAIATRASAQVQMPVTMTPQSGSNSSRRPSWLISEKYLGVAFAVGGVAGIILLLPFGLSISAAWEWYITAQHRFAAGVVAFATFLFVADVAFLFWLGATLVYEFSDPD